jgi:hypothetical protein
MLRAELKKIEARKKEREKKTQDLQKLIAQADSSSKNLSGLDKKALKKKMMGANGSTLQSKSPIKEQMVRIYLAYLMYFCIIIVWITNECLKEQSYFMSAFY